MNEEEIKILEQNKNIRKLKSNEELKRAERIFYISTELQKPKGWIRKRCPKCGNRLNIYSLPQSLIFLYKCKCGYEYAIKI